MTYSPPYALAQVSVNGGPPSPGGGPGAGVVIPASATIQFSGVNTTGWETALWEIYDYPPAWPVPSGWTLIAATGVVQFSGTNLTPNPPVWTAPTISGWGKWGLRLTVNNATDPQGAVNFPRMVDTSLALTMYSLHGFHDGLAGEQSQFIAASPAPNRQWAEDYKLNVRTMESLAASGGSISPTQGAVALTGGVLNSDVAVSGLTSIRFTGCTAGTSLGGMNIAPTPVAGVPFDVEFDGPITLVDSDASSSVGNRILTGTSGPILLPPGQKSRARFVRTIVSAVSTYNLQSNGVHQVNEVNVKDFGARGDGVTDDTVAIQAAVIFGISQGGALLFFPAGTYLVSSTITIPTTGTSAVNLRLEGAGRGISTIAPSAAFNVFTLVYPPNTTCLSNFAMENLSIVAGYSVAAWAPSTPYLAGALVTSGMSPFVFKCTTPGTSGAYPPFGTMLSSTFTDPVVTLTGTPAAAYNQILIWITTGAVLASTNVRFSWSTDGGLTWTTGATGAASVALGATGLTAHFAAGTYVTAVSLYGSSAGFYATPTNTYGFTAMHGTTVTDGGTLVWTPVEAAGLLCVNCDLAVERCSFTMPMGIIWDGVEAAVCRSCEFNGLNGIWCTGANIRQNNPGTDTNQHGSTTAGGNTFTDLIFTCLQIGISLVTVTEGAIRGIVFEAGVWYAWLAGSSNMRMQDVFSEGGSHGVFVGSFAPYAGLIYGVAFNVKITNSEIETGSGGYCMQSVPQAGIAYPTPFEQVELEQCQFGGGLISYVFFGTGLGNGLRTKDCLLPTNQALWFSEGGPARTYVNEDSSNIHGVGPFFGMGTIPQVGFDSAAGFALRPFTLNSLTPDGTAINYDVFIAESPAVEITTTAAAFSIAGIAGGTNGQIIEWINLTGQQCTLKHQDASDTTAANRLICPAASDIVIPAPPAGGFTGFKIKYSASKSRWLVTEVFE